jgi:hypothetical protein
MQRPLLACVLLFACGGSEGESSATQACLWDAKPRVWFGLVEHDVFSPLEDGEELELRTSPQGGFGLLVHIETTGLGPDEEHAVNIQIDTFLDDTDVGGFVLSGAKLACDGAQPGRFGAMLLTLDQEAYVTMEDVLVLEGERLDLQARVTDDAGTSAETTASVTIAVP